VDLLEDLCHAGALSAHTLLQQLKAPHKPLLQLIVPNSSRVGSSPSCFHGPGAGAKGLLQLSPRGLLGSRAQALFCPGLGIDHPPEGCVEGGQGPVFLCPAGPGDRVLLVAADSG